MNAGFPAGIAVAAVLDELAQDDTACAVQFVCFDAETAELYRVEFSQRPPP